ncbi:hypothetical protein NDU88_004631 [Pleurodeles waltl]|uniref:Uncharacterized protein n=1 Tax=Pleurodeles waltl TaxID=8319 RepID=A0AAV7RJA6_PLEWA|nr:hypothetical protein NDU88_004631 [Pleurodeles waltl]
MCSPVSENQATYGANSQSEKSPGGPTEKDAAEAGNPDIWVPKCLKRNNGQRTHVLEREEDAGRKDTEVAEGEPATGGAVTSRDDPTEGQEGPRKQEIHHVPGGAWLQQVRSCLKDKLRAIVGREEGVGGE